MKRLDRNFRAPSGNVAITGCCVRKRHPAAGQKSILFPSGFFNILIFQILNNIFDTMQFLPIPLQPLPHPQPPAAPTPQARKSFDQTFSKVCGVQGEARAGIVSRVRRAKPASCLSHFRTSECRRRKSLKVGLFDASGGKGAGRPCRRGGQREVLRRSLPAGVLSYPAGREQGICPCTPRPLKRPAKLLSRAFYGPLIHMNATETKPENRKADPWN